MVRRSTDAKVRFGPYEFDRATGELRKHGLRLKLQGHPVLLLEALLEQPGAVVPREEIQRRLWPADTFVDFENGLNTAVKRLRTALADSAEKPVYVETVARAGYRFIAPVSVPAAAPEPGEKADVAERAERAGPVARRQWVAGAALGALGGGFGTAWWLRRSPASPPAFTPVTFQRGAVYGARFAPDGRSILYTAQTGSGPRRLYLHNGVSPESRDLGFDDYSLLSVSARGELALSRINGTMPIRGGTLERVMMNGGTPRRMGDDVFAADFGPDGRALAVIRAKDGASQLEYPEGRVLHRSSGWLSSVRVAPDGRTIAFLEHPVRHDDAGLVRLAGADGRLRASSRPWPNAGGLAWRGPDELWLTATAGKGAKSVWRLSMDGQASPVLAAAGPLTLTDISPVTGRALVQREARRLEMAGSLRGGAPQDLSWLDWSRVADVSGDGGWLLFEESGEAANQQPVTHVRNTATGATVRLGEGAAQALSPDGREALLIPPGERRRLVRMPLEGGSPREVASAGLSIQWAKFYPDDKSLLVLASEGGQPLRLYRLGMATGQPPLALTPPGMVRHAALSRDGRRLAVLDAAGRLLIYPAHQPGPAVEVPAREPLGPILWRSDGRGLYVQHLGVYTEVPSRVSIVDVETGRLEPWRRVGPQDAMGVNSVTRVMVSSDERTWVISYRRLLSELYQVSA